MKIRIKSPIWGVPITFLYSYNPSQFKILGQASGNTRKSFSQYHKSVGYQENKADRGGCCLISGKIKYSRLMIRSLE